MRYPQVCTLSLPNQQCKGEQAKTCVHTDTHYRHHKTQSFHRIIFLLLFKYALVIACRKESLGKAAKKAEEIAEEKE